MRQDVRAARRQALGFSVLVLLFAALYEVAILRAGGMRAVPGVILFGLMWVPLSVSFALRIVGRESFAEVGWRRGPWRGLALAYVLPAGCAGFTYGAALLTGVVSFAPPEKFAGHPAPVSLWLSSAAMDATLMVAIGLIGAFGEEVGWRGYLQPRSIRAGFRAPLVFTGVIWGLYHFR
ncbi:CPBP family intramembrane metalloprotease [Nannocystis sp. RBIL2]|uniref:CPBP family intramembrane glutamic endopeptidase n=1 Tax=Nannocystis sp. RBIL2 TaxID=2996788 RepID=UPI00226E229E|nr:CPBP family intramembrane glutamic endopeptidase [Nannocystis sp. RBIL2]MCY1063475.1 CPBP family intramembrane metalloprotease [Nannocystis sp. RBIL2]